MPATITGIPQERLAAYNAARQCNDTRSICHAPDYSMYFGRDGLVSACCYSRSNSLGRYPDQTISNLWRGEKARELRSQMRGQILPQGCEICADQLMAGNYKGLLAGHFDPFANFPAQNAAPTFPSRMEFELSNKCNLECSMCSGFFSSSIRSNREQLAPLPQVYDSGFAEQLMPFVPHLREAKFFGGEPFLIDLYYSIWELFIETNPSCRVAITTNGTVFTAKVRRVLENLNCQIIVSIDSLRKNTYEGIRKNAVFERVLENIDLFMQINRGKGQPLCLSVCPMTTNWEELPEMVEFANARGFGIFFNTVVFPQNLSLKHLKPREQGKVADFLRRALRQPANATEANNFRCLEDVCLQVEMWRKEKLVGPDDQIRLQCELYLDKSTRSPITDSLHSVLSDIAEEDCGDGDKSSAQVSHKAPDARAVLHEFMSSIWRLGAMLKADGLVPAARYSEADLREYLRLCDEKLPESNFPGLLNLARQNPLVVLHAVGSHSPNELVELAQAYHG